MKRNVAKQDSARCASGLTLIETLCVVTLLALTAAVLLPNLAPASGEEELRATVVSIQDLDRRARLVSVREGPVELSVELVPTNTSEERKLSLRRADRTRNADPLASVALPSEAAVAFEIDREPLDAIRFDARGNAPDYRVVLRVDDTLRAWRVSGVSGWITREQTP